MQELKRMKQKLAAAAGSSNSSITGASSSPTSTSLLLLQQQAGKANAPTLGLASAAAGALPQRRLPSISDSETLPTEVDRALWEEQHQQTLQQQEFQRQVSRSFPSAASNSAAAGAAAGSAGAASAAVGVAGVASAAGGAYTSAGRSSVSGAAGGPVRTLSCQQLLQQMQRMQQQEETGGSSMYVDDSHMEQSGEQRAYNTNVHSTMCGEDSPLVLLSRFSTTVDGSQTQSYANTETDLQ
jgi:hypothetical protein